jgi:uncharacterized protein YjeT (DUF2065 family)
MDMIRYAAPARHNPAASGGHPQAKSTGRDDMLFIRILAMILGALAIAAGLLFVCQGTGVVLWPADSFMLSDRAWAVRGAVLTVVGGIIVWLARRG